MKKREKVVLEHTLKTDPAAFQASWDGLKPYEIRSEADRYFSVGDLIILKETKYTGMEMAAGAELIYTGRTIYAIVAHILRSPIYGLMNPWCIMSLKDMVNSTCIDGQDRDLLAEITSLEAVVEKVREWKKDNGGLRTEYIDWEELEAIIGEGKP